MRLEWKRSVVIFLTGLLIGAALGVGGWRCFRRGWHGEKHYERMLERFSSKLDLTADQKTKVAAILESKRRKMLVLHSEIGPKFEEIRASTRNEIRVLLTPAQQVKFDALQAKWESRWEKRRARHKERFGGEGP